MPISKNINRYINNSLIRGKLCSWDKNSVFVFITPITGSAANKEFMYSQVERAISSWNSILRANNIPVQFLKVLQAEQADIVVHWVKVGRVYEGMCKYLSVVGTSLKKISIDIGLPNSYGRETTDLSIYCAIMHEFGHALGLGHGVEVDDIMFVPHQKNISTPSDNDILVLKQIYQQHFS